jgi:hypothetical protein
MSVEPEIRSYLILIANTIALVLIFLLIGLLFGVYLGYAFFEGTPTWKNWIFYLLYVILFILLIRKLKRKWSQ